VIEEMDDEVLVINLTAAKALRLPISDKLMALADGLIE